MSPVPLNDPSVDYKPPLVLEIPAHGGKRLPQKSHIQQY